MIIYLDDEPLEHIFYGEGNYTPVVVNLGIAAEPAIERLNEAQNNHDWLALIEITKELSTMERPLLLERSSDSFLPGVGHSRLSESEDNTLSGNNHPIDGTNLGNRRQA